MNEPSGIGVESIAQDLFNNKLILIVGAGVSMAYPSELPSAEELASELSQQLQNSSLASMLASVPADDLLAIADAAAADSDDALNIVRSTILNRFDFRTAAPNYAHKALALLASESIVQVMSTNWDTCIEAASI